VFPSIRTKHSLDALLAMSSNRWERDVPAATSIHSTDSGSRPVKNNARRTFRPGVGIGHHYDASSSGLLRCEYRSEQDWQRADSREWSAELAACGLSFGEENGEHDFVCGERLLGEFARALGDVATVAVVLPRVLDPRCFRERVSKMKQMVPTAAQKKDRNRLDNPKANPVALLKPNILPISMVPPS